MKVFKVINAENLMRGDLQQRRVGANSGVNNETLCKYVHILKNVNQ